MTKLVTTVIKIGDSYALSVPTEFIKDARLEVGDKVELPLPLKFKRQDPVRIEKLVEELQALKPFKDIKDPVAWQREIRKDRPLPGRE